MPQNELLDAIFKCFKQYEFYSLKRLHSDLKQPEVYLRQTLELVAHSIKSGRHSGLWQLKPESKHQGYENSKPEQAPEVASPGVSDMEMDELDDDNVEMEDVQIQ